MKVLFLVFLLVCAAITQGAVTIKNQSVSVDANARTVTVSYELEGDDAVVTFDVLKDEVSIGGACLKNTSGDVCKLLSAGTHAFTWYADTGWCENVALGAVKVKVEAWATDNPPAYLVCDLVRGSRHYYPSADALPGEGGVTNDLYKTSKLVLRKMPAKGVQWRMGRIESEQGGFTSGFENQHYVTMNADYYIGVFELTYGQYNYTMGTAFTEDVYSVLTIPVTNIAWATIRGTSNGSTDPSSGSFMGTLRARLGNIKFDFPTDEQWEYACRAGCGMPFANGRILDSDYEMGWYSNNSGNHSHPVGTKRPNDWGIYDMHGNVWEMCLDGKYTPEAGVSVAASLHEAAMVNKMVRGGCFRHSMKDYARSSARLDRSNSVAQMDQGFRVACPAIAK